MDAVSIRKGTVFKYKDQLWQAVDVTHRTPGNKRGFVQVKMRSIRDGNHVTEKFSSSERVESAWLDGRKCQYLYNDANTGPVFMDSETYEQFGLSKELLGNAMDYVKENEEVEITFHEGTAIGINLPPKVELVVVETEPAVKGDTVNSVMKPATMETGVVIKVPSHIRVGDKLRISTSSGEFQERVND